MAASTKSTVRPIAEKFAQLRVVVGVLGQAEAANWWSSSFLTKGGIEIAAYNFARGPEFSAVNATSAAAKMLHDEKIGKRSSVHLYRLSLGEESLIHHALRNHAGDFTNEVLGNKEKPMLWLKEQTVKTAKISPGPICIGTISEAFTEAGFKDMASHYLAAFEQQVQCLPYFSDSKE